MVYISGNKDGSIETNRIDSSPGQQQQHRPPPPVQRIKTDGDNNALTLQPSSSSSSAIVGSGIAATATKTIVAADTAVATEATVTSTTTVFGGDTALTSPKRGDPPEELVPTHGAFFFALGCGSALIVTLVAVTSALAYKRTNKSLLRSKSKESLQ